MLESWIENRCWSNYPLIKGKIRAVTLVFNGLGGAVVNTYTPLELALADENILTILPYYGPWSWMNRSSRAYVDDLVERVYSFLQLGKRLHAGIHRGEAGHQRDDSIKAKDAPAAADRRHDRGRCGLSVHIVD